MGVYSASNSSGSVMSMPLLSSTSTSFYPITFYWLTSGSYTVTYYYTLSNGAMGSASAVFNVARLTGPPSVAVNIGKATVGPSQQTRSILTASLTWFSGEYGFRRPE